MRYLCHKNNCENISRKVVVYGLQQELLDYVKILINDYMYNTRKLLI